jgi:hypothetical protein
LVSGSIREYVDSAARPACAGATALATPSAVPPTAVARVRFASGRARGDRSRNRQLVSAAAERESPPTPAYTNQQTADAKGTVCAAFAKVDHALDISARNTGDDPATKLAAATSGRQVLDAGSRYLLTKLVEEPAAPPEVAKEVRKFADSSQELVIGYLDGLTNSDADLQPSLSAGDETTLTIRRLCK